MRQLKTNKLKEIIKHGHIRSAIRPYTKAEIYKMKMDRGTDSKKLLVEKIIRKINKYLISNIQSTHYHTYMQGPTQENNLSQFSLPCYVFENALSEVNNILMEAGWMLSYTIVPKTYESFKIINTIGVCNEIKQELSFQSFWWYKISIC